MAYLKYLLLAGLFILTVSFTFFHNGWANYDQKKTMDFKSTIKESTYENPHCLIKVEYQKKLWTVYLAPISRMTDRGLTEDMLQEGTEVRLVAYPHKTIKTEMRAERIFVAGKKFELR